MFAKIRIFRSAIIALVLLVVVVGEARAQCVSIIDETSTIRPSIINLGNIMTKFANQEENYIKRAVKTVTFMIQSHMKEMELNTIAWWGDWQAHRLSPLMKDAAQQLSVNYAEQSIMLAKVIDAQLMNEHIMMKRKKEIDAKIRYEPSAAGGVLDTFGPYQTKAYQDSKYLGQGLLQEQMNLFNNKKGTAAATGQLGLIKGMWDDYISYFCDNTKGDLGCDGTPPDPEISGRHRDIGALLWGQKQTFELTSEKDRAMLKSAVSFLLYPEVSDPVPMSVVTDVTGADEFLTRRSAQARINALYYAITQMLSERISSTDNRYASDVRERAGVEMDKRSLKPGYREMQETLLRDQFMQPDFFIKLGSESPDQLIKTEVALGAQRSQLVGDWFRREEELLMMMAANYSRELDKQQPSNASSSGSTAIEEGGGR